ncbi:MAG: glycosyltransferase family 2 protein [Alphaproteobacteria bacterium]|nr:glycosyltransferase family 2 protein [Alphaproteobacteria bacterium]
MKKQTEKPDISLIIPCYNIEGHIDDCMQSVMCQKNIRKCEVILVNDGSVDSTKKKLMKYVKRYPKIVQLVENRYNLGVSAARNIGLEKAKGNIMFVDGDDMIGGKLESGIDTYYLENFLDTLNSNPGASMVVGNLLVVDHDNTRMLCAKRFKNLFNHSTKKTIDINSALDLLDKRLSSCAILYRADIIQKYNLRFMPQLTYFEDADFVIRYAFKGAPKYPSVLEVVPDFSHSYYIYRRRTDSAMTKLSCHSEKYMRRLERTQNKLAYYSRFLLRCNGLMGPDSHIYNIVAHRFSQTVKNINVYKKDSDAVAYESLSRKYIPWQCVGCTKNRCIACGNNDILLATAERCKNDLLHGRRR